LAVGHEAANEDREAVVLTKSLYACRWLLLLAVALPAAAEPAELRLVSTVWPPFTDVVGKPRLASDLVHEALSRAGVGAETAIVADGLLVSSMRDGSHDGSGALWRSEERERFLLYSDPYMENRLVLVGHKGSDVSAASFAQLAGRRVALVKGYAYGMAVDDAAGPTFVLGDSVQDNVRRLLEGDVDYMLIDSLVIRYIVDRYRKDADEKLEIGSTPLARRTLHLAIRKDIEGAEAIVRRFNEQIRAMLADGTYNRILDLDWIRADVDGDGQAELVLQGERAGVDPPTDAYEVISGDEPKQDEPKKLRILIGRSLYEDWESVPEQYKIPLPPSGTDPEPATAPLIKIKF
jgi:hypothetical protein